MNLKSYISVDSDFSLFTSSMDGMAYEFPKPA